MNEKELKKIQKNLREKGIIDDETISIIDRELKRFLEDKLERNSTIIVMLTRLIEEKKSSKNKGFTFSLN
ncbi:MAG: hypothetical protein AAF934_09335 [Bacteroidota bacterium]